MALQREVDIELKIQEGIEKITRAKSKKKKGKKSKDQDEVDYQLVKNNKKLAILKHELQKRTAQLQVLQQEEAQRSNSNSERGKTEEVSEDTGLLRVSVTDPITKSVFKKALHIKENQSTIEVIQFILDKSNINGMPTEFQLSYSNKKGTYLSLM